MLLAKVEMPMGTKLKYEEKNGELVVDRVLSVPVPYNYGFLLDTMSGDGDPTDAFIVASEPITAGSMVKFEPCYLIEMMDQGLEDNKYVGCIQGDTPVSNEQLMKVINYLNTYKKGVKIIHVENLKESDYV